MTHSTTLTEHSFALDDQVAWAAQIGRKVAREFGYRDQERDDLVGVAWEMLCNLYRRPPEGTWNKKRKAYIRLGFDVSQVPEGGDPEGQFRGWSHPWIWKKCVRAALEMRGGGTFRSTRPENAPGKVMDLGELAESLVDDSENEDEHVGLSPALKPSIRVMIDDLDRTHYGRGVAEGRHERR